VPVLLYKLYGARTILNTIIQSLTPHNSMLNMSLVRHSVTLAARSLCDSWATCNCCKRTEARTVQGYNFCSV